MKLKERELDMKQQELDLQKQRFAMEQQKADDNREERNQLMSKKYVVMCTLCLT